MGWQRSLTVKRIPLGSFSAWQPPWRCSQSTNANNLAHLCLSESDYRRDREKGSTLASCIIYFIGALTVDHRSQRAPSSSGIYWDALRLSDCLVTAGQCINSDISHMHLES